MQQCTLEAGASATAPIERHLTTEMTLATLADSVTVELGAVQSGGPEGAPAPMPFGSHIIEVAEADAPALGTPVTLTFALQA